MLILLLVLQSAHYIRKLRQILTKEFSWIGNRATDDSAIVKILVHAGAIPIVKTNIPQTMLSFECSNPLWGRTVNPYNKDYTSGGSSGGEAALLASKGASAGLGTDIGGALRFITS